MRSVPLKRRCASMRACASRAPRTSFATPGKTEKVIQLDSPTWEALGNWPLGSKLGRLLLLCPTCGMLRAAVAESPTCHSAPCPSCHGEAEYSRSEAEVAR